MSDHPVSTTTMLTARSSVYLHDDRVEVGATDALFTESLSRVAYRDARRLIAWTATRRVHLVLGGVALLIALLLGWAALAVRGDEGVAFAVVALLVALASGLLLAMGRPGGITRFRLEGVRGHVEGVLSGSLRKRERLLSEIERRIRERQGMPPR